MITFVIILNIGNMNWDYMRPIYHDSGWLPILKGSYTPVAAFSGGCHDDDVRFLYGQTRTSVIAGDVGSRTGRFHGNDRNISGHFNIRSESIFKFLYPVYDLSRYISVMEFIQNVDILIVIIWFLVFLLNWRYTCLSLVMEQHKYFI